MFIVDPNTFAELWNIRPGGFLHPGYNEVFGVFAYVNPIVLIETQILSRIVNMLC